MAAKPPTSPFKFGFYAGLGFICAQIFAAMAVAVVLSIFGLLTFGSVLSKWSHVNSTLMNESTPQTTRSDTSQQPQYSGR